MWRVWETPLASLEARAAGGVTDQDPVPSRVLLQKSHQDPTPELLAWLRAAGGTGDSGRPTWQQHCGLATIIHLSGAGFAGALRNVPVERRLEAPASEVSTPKTVICVAREPCAPEWLPGLDGVILVLVGLKYRGNVGSIVRAAVQANLFEEIHIVEIEREMEPEPEPEPKKASGKQQRQQRQRGHREPSDCDPVHLSGAVADKDIVYYSLCNAPLMPIRRFDSVEDFLRQRETGRRLVGVDGGTTYEGDPHNIYSATASAALRKCGYVAVGAEDFGLPDMFIRECDDLVMIPMLSASINVACAFTAVLTTMAAAAYNEQQAAT